MNINACIYDDEHKLVGCITDSVAAQFRNELDALMERYAGDPIADRILLKLDEMCRKSCEGCNAAFMNALKLLVKKYRYDIPLEMAQSLSRAYHNLLRLCCSGIVYDEVLNATIGQFREEGLEYLGTLDKINGRNAYAFLYDNIHVSVCMVEKDDLYNFWCRKVDDPVTAVICFNGKCVGVKCEDGPRLCGAIKACVDDMRDKGEATEEFDGGESLDDIVNALIEIAKMLVSESKKDC